MIITGTNRPWRTYTVSYTDLQSLGAVLSGSIELFTLPAAGVIHAVKIKHSTTFLTGSAGVFELSLGVTGDTSKYLTPFDVSSTVTATNYALETRINGESHTASASIKLKAESFGGNLNTLTQGSVKIWVIYSVAS